MKLKLNDLFTNTHQIEFVIHIRNNVWREVCDMVINKVSDDVTADIHNCIFIPSNVILFNTEISRNTIIDALESVWLV